MSGTAAVSTRATAAMSTTTISEQDFTTPDRSTAKALTATGSHQEEKKEDILNSSCAKNSSRPSANAKVVTPPDSFSTAASAKDVRFDGGKKNINGTAKNAAKGIEAKTLCSVGSDDQGDNSSSTSSPSAAQRGLVSRRGGLGSGRCGSPGRSRNLVPPPSTGAKPSKEAADAAAAVLEFKTFRSPGNDENSSGMDDDKKVENLKGLPPNVAPMQGRSLQLQPKPKSTKKVTSSSAGISSKKSGNVTFSPVPMPKVNGDKVSPRDCLLSLDLGTLGSRFGYSHYLFIFAVIFSYHHPSHSKQTQFMKTPTKSPTGRFTSLPVLDDDALGSPGAIFLSPTRTPTYFDRKSSAMKSVSGISITGNIARSPLTPRTPKRDLDRDRLLSTPTDFAFDYGKPAANGSLLESSNVLAWLQSPTTNDLFSPGGLGSMLNTPRGGVPKAPPTPTFSTSFFFSDVAGLPKGGDCISPKPGAAGAASDADKRNGNGRGNNNIICISPLSSYKTKNGQLHLGPNSPKINYKDMFASPAERSGMAMLKASQKARAGVQRGGNLDAVHLAERDLMEDEDLSVLLQLASSTPRPSAAVSDPGSTKLEGSKVFRKNGENENLPSLQLPIIGGRDAEGKGTRLTRKTHSRDHNDVSDDRVAKPMAPLSAGPAVDLKQKSTADAAKKPPTTGSMHPTTRPYPPMSYPHHETPYYPSLHPGMAHGGSMRVVVGGPPPNRGKSTNESQRVRAYTIGPRGEYPPPPYPPPPPHYSHHRGAPPPHPMHPHYRAQYPPHPAHTHAAHRHMPIYGAHPKNKTTSISTNTTKKTPLKVVSGKTGLKRPATSSTPKASKKTKKSSQTPKKKNRSPQLVDKAERQKAAATIQAVNQASGGKNDKAAALAAAILRGVTMRPSGKWQAQLYFAGKSRYIGVFDTREKAALAYEIAREKLKSEKSSAEGGVMSPKRTEAAVNAARKAAFEGVNERDPRLAGK